MVSGRIELTVDATEATKLPRQGEYFQVIKWYWDITWPDGERQLVLNRWKK